ncbi:MAG TPA: MBL fold metallo-hydrolase [Xanthomonadaceae bacterium]|jgi:glyoxylase-like metal-dependent hydrolase (beta-lactamase superfamily II)|nr:MBL fold metallo-hydrolase [Xanthomonadaceae bacterium]
MRMPFATLTVALALASCATQDKPLPAPAIASVGGVSVARDTVLIPGVFPSDDEPDGNTIVLRGRDGLIVFDTGRHRAHTQRILDFAKATGQPIVAIVNSHWHLDHVSGNAMLRDAYPQAHVYASHAIEAAMTGFLADERRQLQDAIAKHKVKDAQVPSLQEEIARIDAGSRLFPDRPVEASGMRTLAGRTLQVGLTHAVVTAGDVWLYDPATKVLLSGDLVTLPAPLFDTACAPRWSQQLAALDAVPFDSLVPGHGAVMDHAGFARYRSAFDRLLTCAAGKDTMKVCSDGWLHDTGDLVPASDEKLARRLLGYYIDQVLRVPAVKRERYCTA